MKLALSIFISFGLLFLFYKGIKQLIINGSFYVARKINIKYNYSFETTKGCIELPIIVTAHIIFALTVLKISGLTLKGIGLYHLNSLSDLFYGALLGIGMCGLSFLMILAIIECNSWWRDKSVEGVASFNYVSNWLNMCRSGWMRHHIQTLEVLPLPLAYLVTFSQVTCEEIVFKGAIINYFKSYSLLFAIIFSIVTFSGMQVFFMPNRKSMIFPVCGAFIVGTVSSLVYWQTFSLLPIIIAHFFLFVIAVL